MQQEEEGNRDHGDDLKSGAILLLAVQVDLQFKATGMAGCFSVLYVQKDEEHENERQVDADEDERILDL